MTVGSCVFVGGSVGASVAGVSPAMLTGRGTVAEVWATTNRRAPNARLAKKSPIAVRTALSSTLSGRSLDHRGAHSNAWRVWTSSLLRGRVGNRVGLPSRRGLPARQEYLLFTPFQLDHVPNTVVNAVAAPPQPARRRVVSAHRTLTVTMPNTTSIMNTTTTIRMMLLLIY